MFISIRKRQIQFVLLAALLLALVAWQIKANQEATTQTLHFCRFGEETFIIDAGHGGEDGGAVSNSGLQEDAVNLAISTKLDGLFGFYGVNSLMTRTEDISLHDDSADSLRQKKTSDLKHRVALVNETKNATLISIHQNSFPQLKCKGAQVFYHNDEASCLLATEVQNLVHSFLDPANQRKAQRVSKSVYLMNQVECRAILVECGFLSNPTDEAKLRDDGYQQKIAATIAPACLRG